MGINERREREKNERRRAILNCAKELILLQGVDQVSMEDIARKAELSKATLYLYFSGKELIFNEICEESARIFLSHFKPLLENGVSAMESIRYFWRGYVELFGNFDEMLIVFKVRSFLNPWPALCFHRGTKPVAQCGQHPRDNENAYRSVQVRRYFRSQSRFGNSHPPGAFDVFQHH